MGNRCGGNCQSFCRLCFFGVRGGGRGDAAGVIESVEKCASSAGVVRDATVAVLRVIPQILSEKADPRFPTALAECWTVWGKRGWYT